MMLIFCLFFLLLFLDVNMVSQRCPFGVEAIVKQPCFDFWRENHPGFASQVIPSNSSLTDL